MILKRRTKRKGLTLVEILIGLTFLSFIIILSVNLLKHGMTYSSEFNNEFNFQSDMRDAMEVIEANVKSSSAVFGVTQKMFLNKDKRWQYIGIGAIGGKNEGQLVQFIPNGRGGHTEKALTKRKSKVWYSLEFKPLDNSSAGQRVLSFKLIGTPIDKNGQLLKEESRELTTSVEALNSYAVVSKAKPNDPAVSIAFRTDRRTPASIASLTIIVDVSAGMLTGINGDIAPKHNSNDTKLELMKDTLRNLLKRLEPSTGLYVNMIKYAKFGTYATTNGLILEDNGYMLIQKNIDRIDDYVDSLKSNHNWNFNNLSDGMRVGFLSLENFVRKIGDGGKGPHYILVLTNGMPNAGSIIDGNVMRVYREAAVSKNVYTSPGRRVTTNLFPIAFNPNMNLHNAIRLNLMYVAQKWARPRASNYIKNSKIYLVKVGNTRGAIRTAEQNMDWLARYFNAENRSYIDATDKKKLDKFIDKLSQNLQFDMWYINGPSGG